MRSQILAGEPRIDGRDTRTVRPIEIRTGVLPRAHGSALFTRGETQALVAATLGTERDSQRIDALAGEYSEHFMLHYNMPPFATGETGRVGTPEAARDRPRPPGQARAGRRAARPRPSSRTRCAWSREITESNGSSSMASVCGGCLALMDAGVPMKAHVAGIAMGLIKEGNRFAVLTDILGDEDHLGDMDFKVAGTTTGITALQMDIKIQGITKEIMQVALAQAKEARLHILGKMAEAMGGAKTEVSQFAPRLYTMKINPEKIRDVIGKGGSTIRALTEETGCTIDIGEDGTITIASTDADKAAYAKKRIEEITAEVEVGKVYEGPITKILDFGALVNLLPGKDGLLHISQIAHQRVEKVTDYLQEGQVVRVKVLETDEKGRVKLSMKALLDRDTPPREFAAPVSVASDARRRQYVRAIEITAPRQARGAARRPSGRRRRSAPGEVLIRVARVGRQPARRAAAQGPLPGAAGRVRHARASKSPATIVDGDRRRAGGGRASRSATASARWSPAAATPSSASRRSASACRCPPRPERHRGREPAGDLLHRLVERVRPRPAAAGRDAAGAGRHQRHRRHRDPAGQGVGRDGDRHRGQRREVPRPASRSAPTTRSTTRRRTSSPRSSA